MAVAFVKKSTRAAIAGGSTASPSLASVGAGNLVVLVVGASRGDTAATAIAAPSGWTAAQNPAGPSIAGSPNYTPVVAIFYKLSSAGGTESATVILPSGSYGWAQIAEFSGGPFTFSSGQSANGIFNTTATSRANGTTGANTIADAVYIAVGHPEDTVGSVSALGTPSGMTSLDLEAANNAEVAWSAAYLILTNTGTRSATYSWTTNAYFAGAGAIFEGPAGAGTVTCDLAVTDTADTLSASAAVAISASLGVTDAADTLASAAAVLVVANAAATDADDTLSATATIGAAPVTCDLAVTDDPDTLAATAALTVSAALSATDAADTITATAAALLAANLAVSDASDALAADADVLVVTALGVTDAADTLEALVLTEPLPEIVANLAVTDENDTLQSVVTVEPDRRGHGGRNAGRMPFRVYDDFYAPPIDARLAVRDDDDAVVSRARVSWVQRVVRARITDADDVVQAAAVVVPWPALELMRTQPALQREGVWRPISRVGRRGARQ